MRTTSRFAYQHYVVEIHAQKGESDAWTGSFLIFNAEEAAPVGEVTVPGSFKEAISVQEAAEKLARKSIDDGI